MDTPALRFPALRRGRITELIGGSPDELSPLTLLRAPAGFGKTTAAAHWAEELREAADIDLRWVRSAEPGSDPRLIWYRIRESLGGDDRRRELSQVRDDVDRILTGLRRPIALVIDDYERVTSGELDLSLARLLERSDRLYLAVLGRRFTALDGPLVSSRVGVTLLSGEQLSLTEHESVALAALYGVVDLEYIAQLHRRAHGWPVMMRTMLQRLSEGAGPRDSARTLAVFGRQLLDEMTAPGARRALLGAVLCPGISVELLAELIGEEPEGAERTARELCERGLLQESFWEHTTRYRCHDGLAGPLGPLALQEFGDDARAIRLRHAADLGRDDSPAAAMQLLDAEEYDGVSRLLARYFLEILHPGSGVIQRLQRIPDQTLRGYPVLIGAALYLVGPEHETPDQRTEQLHQWLRTSIRSELREGNYEQNIAAIGLLLVAERMRGDGAEALRISRDAETRIGQVPEGRLSSYRFTLPLLFAALGLAGLVAGDLELGERGYRRAVEMAERYGIDFEALRGWNGVAAVTATAGDLRAAEEHLRRGRMLSERAGIEAPQFSGFNVVLAEALIAIERGDAERASAALEAGHGMLHRIEQWPLLVIAEARARELCDGPCAAIELLERRRAEAQGGLPATLYLRCALSAHAARLHVRVGNYAEAGRLLDALPQPHPDVVLAGALLLLYRGDADGALRRTEQTADLRLSHRQRIEGMLVAAAAHWAGGDAERAVERFSEAGRLMRELGLGQLLGAVPYKAAVAIARAARDAGEADLVAEVEGLPATMRAETFDPLTRAELRTLEVLATGLTLPRIADQLFITENTVKFHLRRIYRKLKVVGRAEAVERAREMRLVPADPEA